jgi:DNA-binding XRE family transcriptional regulator
MLAVVKTPHTEFKIEGDIPDKLIDWLNGEYDDKLQVVEDDNDVLENWFETDLHRQIAARMTAGDRLKIHRENAGLTQAALAKKTGFSPQRISDMECGRRAISIAAARRLAAVLGVTAAEIIVL